MVIKEYPSIAIDDFRHKTGAPAPELCFLTHMHEDHTAGLARKSYYGPVVYCTAITKALLLNYRTRSGAGELKYKHLRREVCGKELVKELELNRPYEFELKSGTSVQVTLLEANHCPGNGMVLIQPRSGEGESILFTGDLKCERLHLDSLSRNPAVKPFLSSNREARQLSLYVDDTFLQHADPFKSYVENHIGISDLVALLKSYPQEVHFCLGDRVTGHEEMLISLAEELKTKIHMDAYYYNLYSMISESSPLASKLVSYCTTILGDTSHDFDKTRLHFCQKNMSCLYREPHAPMAYFKPCSQPTQRMIDLQNAQHAAATIPPGIMTTLEEHGNVFQGPDQRYYFDPKNQKFFPLFPWFYFSRHASYPEIRRLRDMLNVCSVRSLSGTLIPSLTPISEAYNGVTNAGPSNLTASDVLTTKRVRSLVGGLVSNGEDLPIVSKKPRILPFYDRVRLQQRRERAQKRFKRGDSEHGSSKTDSEDEDDRHNAMMLLGKGAGDVGIAASRQSNHVSDDEQPQTFGDERTQPQKDSEKPHANSNQVGAVTTAVKSDSTAMEEEPPFVDESTCEDSPRLPDSSTSDASKTIQFASSCIAFHTPVTKNAVESALKTSWLNSRGDGQLNVSESHCCSATSSCNNFIDETLDDVAGNELTPLVQKLRDNPSCWFDFRFDFVNS